MEQRTATPSAAGDPVTRGQKNLPRVGFDARFSIGQYRGMGRFLRRLIRGYEDRFLAFCADGECDDVLKTVAGGFQFYPLWEQVSLPRLAREHGLDIFIAPYNTAPLRLPSHTRLVLIVHDLIFLRSTRDVPRSVSLYQNLGRAYRQVIVPKAMRRADRIICVSEYTRSELLRQFQVSPEVIRVIPNTLEEDWFHIDRIEGDHDFVLCVSGEAPSKNLAKGIAGYAAMCRMLGEDSPDLRVVGVKSRFHERYRVLAENLGVGARVKLLGYVTEPDLRRLYASARVFFFPSRCEGFGIPVLEAMACGTPVVASHATSIPELAGNAARYFDPDSPCEMSVQLGTVLSQSGLAEEMSQRGRRRAWEFHPASVDSLIAEFWKELLSR